MVPSEPSNVVALPIWNVQQLSEKPEATVLVTGSQEAALAAETYFPSYVVVTGALSADWKPLAARTVRILPEGGEGGADRGRKLAKILMPIAAELTFYSQQGMAEGWNLSTALAQGWTQKEVMEFIARENGKHVAQLKRRKKTEVVPSEVIEPETVEPIKLQKDRDRICATAANALELLSKHSRYKGRIWFDEFGQRLMLDKHRFEKKIQGVECQIWMQQEYNMHQISESAIGNAAMHLARTESKHHLKAYLDGIQWDGAERLPSFMANVYGTESTAYTQSVGRCWMIAAVARVYQPGCKADNMIVLEGGQGIFKSTSLRILAGEWFNESHEDPIRNRKDFLGQLQGYWIIEIPEMHSIAGNVNGIEKIKGIISCQTDDYRRPWGDTSVPYPRQCIFAGTTNLRQWNSDPTGGRRFWPIACGKIDLGYLTETRDQLWAEAVSRYKSGEGWWDVPYAEALEQQELRRTADIWEPLIERYITHEPTYHEDRTSSWVKREKPLEFIQLHRVLTEALNKPIGGCNRSDQMRAASVVTVMGYVRQRCMVDGARAYVYRKDEKLPLPPPDDDSDVPY